LDYIGYASCQKFINIIHSLSIAKFFIDKLGFYQRPIFAILNTCWIIKEALRRRSKYFTFSLPSFGSKFNRKFGRNLNGISRLNNTPRIVLYGRLAKFAFFGLIGVIIIMVGLFIWYGRDLPTPGKLIAAQSNQSSGL